VRCLPPGAAARHRFCAATLSRRGSRSGNRVTPRPSWSPAAPAQTP